MSNILFNRRIMLANASSNMGIEIINGVLFVDGNPLSVDSDLLMVGN